MKRCFVWLALALLSGFFLQPAGAQGLDAAQSSDPGVFAEFTGARTGQGLGTLWGGSAGAFIQGHLLGLVIRGTAVPTNASARLYDAVLGPRLALNLPILRLYVEAGGGVGYNGYESQYGTFASGWGPAWQADAGVSHSLFQHLDWRILEIASSHIYVGPGVTPVIASTGLSLHFR